LEGYQRILSRRRVWEDDVSPPETRLEVNFGVDLAERCLQTMEKKMKL